MYNCYDYNDHLFNFSAIKSVKINAINNISISQNGTHISFINKYKYKSINICRPNSKENSEVMFIAKY